jgi:5-methyltetrahydropteroyltriglutamate--homocysteine methyltransferase
VKSRQIDLIPSNDFSLYDRMLDTAVMLNIIPERFRREEFDELQCYFAMARGYQERGIDLKALDMKKWFTTNYHYVVPEYEEGMDIRPVRNRAVEEYNRALALGITTRPALIGPYTFCSRLSGFSRRRTIPARRRSRTPTQRSCAGLAASAANGPSLTSPAL